VGSGTPPEPQGIKNQSGVALLPFGSVTPTDFDFVVDGIGAVWAANFEPTARITNAALATSMAKFKSSVDSQPLQPPPAVVAVPAFRTNQLPSTGSPGVSDLFVGDFTQLLLGMRTEFQLEVSRQAADAASSAFTNMQVWIRAYLRADIQLAHPEAFSVTTDIGE
jgi:HK97 family phage major capsid protein